MIRIIKDLIYFVRDSSQVEQGCHNCKNRIKNVKKCISRIKIVENGENERK
jgi:hypothetical protein